MEYAYKFLYKNVNTKNPSSKLWAGTVVDLREVQKSFPFKTQP
jgi:hypothetical protein